MLCLRIVYSLLIMEIGSLLTLNREMVEAFNL